VHHHAGACRKVCQQAENRADGHGFQAGFPSEGPIRSNHFRGHSQSLRQARRCRRVRPNSTRSRMSGSSCATTGCRIVSSPPTAIFSITAAWAGTSSSTSPGASCPSACATGHTGADQWDLVLDNNSTISNSFIRKYFQPPSLSSFCAIF
jgi:hypothetical protein